METKIAKIGVSAEADQALDRMVARTNEGFTGGRVSKNDLTSWIILHFENHGLDAAVEKIRKEHFDSVAYLESVVRDMKQARRNGAAIPDINTLLAPVSSQIKSIPAQTKPRSKGGFRTNSDQIDLSANDSEIKSS